MSLSPISCCGPQPKVVEQDMTRKRSPKNYIGMLKKDTEIDIEELRNVLQQDKCS